MNNNKFEYLLIYGIRRVGKTRLINKCLKDDEGYIEIECKYYDRKLSLMDYENEVKQLSRINLKNMRIGLFQKVGLMSPFQKRLFVINLMIFTTFNFYIDWLILELD